MGTFGDITNPIVRVNFNPTGIFHYAELIEDLHKASQFAVVNNNVASWGTTSNKQAVYDAVKSYLEDQYLFTPWDGLEQVNSTEYENLPSTWIEL